MRLIVHVGFPLRFGRQLLEPIAAVRSQDLKSEPSTKLGVPIFLG